MSGKDYKPDIGSNRPGPHHSRTLPGDATTYADLDLLNHDLSALLDFTSDLIADLEADLKNYDLLVYADIDPRLIEAHQIEWPNALGRPSEAISYSYYKTLKLRNTASARYIRKRYEEAIRDVAGTLSLDLVILTDLIRNEIFLVQDFLSSTIQDVDDSSEFRILETLQDWVQSGTRYAGTFREIFANRDQRTIPFAEIDRATAAQARQGQAVSKAKLNSHNNLLVQEIESLQRNFAEFSEVFYKRYLKPSIDFRLEVGRVSRVGITGLESEVANSSRILMDSVRLALADEIRRKDVFERKLKNALEHLDGQNRARNAVKELAEKGKPLPSEGARILKATNTDTQYTESDYLNYIYPEQSSSQLASSHSVLSGLDQDDHPQYLPRIGGTITGPVELAEGVTLDGIVPSTHRHTGSDGSPQINGADIIGGTLSEEAVDSDRKPSRPEDLVFVKYLGSSSSGLVDATMSWYGDSRYTYEIQVARIEVV